MTDDFGPSTGDAIRLLLEHAQERVNETALAAPLDLRFADLALGIAAAHHQTSAFASTKPPRAEGFDELDMLDSLIRAEQLARSLTIGGASGEAASDLVIALCDLIREACPDA